MSGKYVYALVDPRHGVVRYIGVAKDPQKRLRSHVVESRSERHGDRLPHRCRWIRKLLFEGVKPKMIILEGIVENWQEREKYWIKEHRERGCMLTNSTDGGEGCSGMVPTEEQKLRMSIAHLDTDGPIFIDSSGAYHSGSIVKCKQCLVEFIALRCEVNRGNADFCGKSCATTYRQENLLSSNSIKPGEAFLNTGRQRYRAIESKCQECCVSFLYKATSRKEQNKGKFCSKSCATRHRRKSIKDSRSIPDDVLTMLRNSDGVKVRAQRLSCTFCSKEFLIPLSGKRDLNNICCSHSCKRQMSNQKNHPLLPGERFVYMGNQKRRVADRNCENCCKPFHAQVSEIKYGKGRFCSRSCSMKSVRASAVTA